MLFFKIEIEKDIMYNSLCEEMKTCKPKVGFPRVMPADVVSKHMMTIVNALWYLDGNKDKIQERNSHCKDVQPIPNRLLYSVCMYFYIVNMSILL